LFKLLFEFIVLLLIMSFLDGNYLFGFIRNFFVVFCGKVASFGN